MDWELVLEAIKWIAIILLGGLSVYFKTKGITVETLTKKASEFIVEAETKYADLTKAGGEKHDWVVIQLYHLIPTWLKNFISIDFIDNLVDTVFDSVQNYATKQLDKIVETSKVETKE